MSGGSSKSSTQQQSEQSTTTPTVEGVGISDIIQGDRVSVTQNFPTGVQEVVSQLIDLSSKSIQTAAGAGETASRFAERSLAQVAQRLERQEQPEFSIVRDALPIGVILALGFAIYTLNRK